jgi:pilus assembly protein TadC
MNTNLVVAVLGAIGMLFVVSSVRFGPLPRRGKRVRLQDGARKMGLDSGEDEVTILRNSPWLDRALTPVLEDWAGVLGHLVGARDQVQHRLIQLNWPPPYRTLNDFYATKVLMALLLFVPGVVFALLVASLVGVWLILVVPLFLAILGFFLPDIQLCQQVKRREEMLLFEMSFVLGRVGVQLAAGRTFADALIQLTSRPGKGGWFLEELARVAAAYTSGESLMNALTWMAEKNRLPDVDRFVQRIKLSERAGSPLAGALQQMGQTTQAKVENILVARGQQNLILMILPLGLALIGVFLALLAPGVDLAIRGML